MGRAALNSACRRCLDRNLSPPTPSETLLISNGDHNRKAAFASDIEKFYVPLSLLASSTRAGMVKTCPFAGAFHVPVRERIVPFQGLNRLSRVPFGAGFQLLK